MGNEKILQERYEEERKKADAIVKLCEDEKRGMTVDEKSAFDAHVAECKRIQAEAESLQRAKDARRELDAVGGYSVPSVVADKRGEKPGEQAPRVEFRENEHTAYQKGDALGAIVSARMRFGPWEHQRAVEWARKAYGENSPQCRALQQSSFTAGGAFIPENFVGREFIERLTAQAQVRAAGARSLPLINGSATVPKLTGGATGSWIGSEGANATPSEQTTGELKLVEKKYMVLVPISNDLRRNSSLEAERIVRDDMITVASNDEDSAFLKGSGLAGQPKGIYNWVPAAGKGNSAGTTLANVRTDIRSAKNRLDNNNVPYVRRAWFMPSRSMNYMGWDLVDGNSNFAFPSLQSAGGATLGGDPVRRDNNISITLGAGSNATEHYYVEMSECFIGDSLELSLELIENATYAVSGSESASLRSGVSRDESVIRLIRKTDFAMRHVESAFVLEAVTYGA